MENIRICKNKARCAQTSYAGFLIEDAERITRFHKSFPEYSITPLRFLSSLSEALSISAFIVKDESYRFGLNAFKVLGGSYAIGQRLCREFNLHSDTASFPAIKDALKGKEGLCFITATDGNHGRGVAWTANRLGQRSVVYMPRGTVSERLENIKKLGSEASITELLYDDAVRKAASDAKENGWYLIQDTSFEGYDEVPHWIMQGYSGIGYEITEQIGESVPTHIFLQAGVGSMAGAMAAFFRNVWGEAPVITIVEPHAADCLYRTAEANDGRLHNAEGEMKTIMAGLACGEPCPEAWSILSCAADYFITISDDTAALGMKTLGRPLGEDDIIISGESGASSSGAAISICKSKELRKTFGINSDSIILCISTEGDTDRENYKKVVFG